ncbi:MAG: prolipoprotein diacylglyceryl transferase [Candidatus Kuenenbacteria bacterium]
MFLHTYHPSPIFLDFGFIQIHWYGLLITLSAVIGFLIAKKLFKQYKLSESILYDLGFYLIIFGLLGARFWHVLSRYNYYFANPVEIFKIWNGGLAIHGAVTAGILIIWFYSRKKLNSSPLLLMDIFAPLVILGQAIGRWGNYFNQELYGKPLDAWWAIPIDFMNRIPGYIQYEFFHPTFFYESLWCLLLFFLLVILHITRLKSSTQNKPIAALLHCYIVKYKGSIFLIYLLFYSIERFFIGFLRIDPMLSWLNLRLDQLTSLLLIILSLIGIFFMRRAKN